jgi:hypothetical protein
MPLLTQCSISNLTKSLSRSLIFTSALFFTILNSANLSIVSRKAPNFLKPSFITTGPACNTILNYTPPEMNPFWEKEKSLTSRTYDVELSKGEVTVVASNIIRHRQGILELTRIDYGYEDMDTCRKTTARIHSYPIYLHKPLDQEHVHGRHSAAGRLHSRQNAMNRVMSDRPPSQPRSRHQKSGGSCSVSLKESHKNLVVGEGHRRGSRVFERLQQSESKWNSGSGALADRPPSQPFNRHGISGASDESRWSSGCHL